MGRNLNKNTKTFTTKSKWYIYTLKYLCNGIIVSSKMINNIKKDLFSLMQNICGCDRLGSTLHCVGAIH